MTFLFWIELLLWYWGVPIILWFETCLCIYLITLLIAKDGYYYHCWLDYDTGLMWAQIVPMFVLVFLVIIAIFIIIITVNHHKKPHSETGSHLCHSDTSFAGDHHGGSSRSGIKHAAVSDPGSNQSRSTCVCKVLPEDTLGSRPPDFGKSRH